jgi:hypothetical protein
VVRLHLRLRLRWARRLWLEREWDRLRSLGSSVGKGRLAVGVVALDVGLVSCDAAVSVEWQEHQEVEEY